MRFGSKFLFFKVFSLALRATVFLSVLLISEGVLGKNLLMSFLSLITIAGIALGFGATDSLVVCSEVEAIRISQLVNIASLAGVGISIFLLLDSYWVNFAIVSVNYGLTFWNMGIIRRHNSYLFERIANIQMLIFWSIYLFFLNFEDYNFIILSTLYVFMNGVIALIAFKNKKNNELPDVNLHNHSLQIMAFRKLAWELNYSTITRLPFVLQGFTTTIHSIFSYAYFLFEMTSAILSHYQTIFLKSNRVNTHMWFRICFLLLGVNVSSLLFLIITMHYRGVIYDNFFTILGLQNITLPPPLLNSDMACLFIFMLAITLFQMAAYGRYSQKLDANTPIIIFANSLSAIAYIFSWFIFVNYPLYNFVPFVAVLFAGLILLVKIVREVKKQSKIV